jgi:ankyrin repeat protein
VFCQLEILRHCFPPSVRCILDELPESLDETYERILREIRKPNQGHAHRMLQCLVVAVRPLRVEELAEVLVFDFNVGGTPKLNPGWRWEDQEEAVMSACSSLVTIVKDGDSRVVQFSHFSVKEFLTADRLAEPIRDESRYHIRLEAAHTVLAQACLGVLLRLDDRVDRDSIKSFPLARYAAQYWVTHARVQNVSSCIKDGMECLFDADKPYFTTWIWIYNEDGPAWGRSMFTMHRKEPEAVPLYHAAIFGFRDLAEHLITEHPEHVNARGGKYQTPMHAAANAGHANIISLLIEHGAEMEARSGSINGGTPLNRAAWGGRLEVGQCLLDRGADINARDHHRHTPLIHAAMVGHVEFARMLLDRGANINARDSDLHTPLIHAMYEEHVEFARMLLDCGADINAQDRYLRTPLIRAAFAGHVEFTRMLLERGAVIDAQSIRGRTALSYAAVKGHTQAVRLLLEHGADVNVCDDEGQTASQLTTHREIVELVSKYGAKSV